MLKVALAIYRDHDIRGLNGCHRSHKCYDKREKWVATQMAWFAKWLQDDPTWWEALYPKKRL